MAARDIALARMTGSRLHLLHISTPARWELVRRAKEEGLPVTAEATPHHIGLTEVEVEGYDANAKVNPPAPESDRAAIAKGLAEGVIDSIATDHAPHSPEEKDQEFDLAPPGFVGLETAFGLVATHLLHTGLVGLPRLIEVMSAAPAHPRARGTGLDTERSSREPRRPGHGGWMAGRPGGVPLEEPQHAACGARSQGKGS